MTGSNIAAAVISSVLFVGVMYGLNTFLRAQNESFLYGMLFGAVLVFFVLGVHKLYPDG